MQDLERSDGGAAVEDSVVGSGRHRAAGRCFGFVRKRAASSARNRPTLDDVAILLLVFGAGLIVSALAAYGLSRKLGLLDLCCRPCRDVTLSLYRVSLRSGGLETVGTGRCSRWTRRRSAPSTISTARPLWVYLSPFAAATTRRRSAAGTVTIGFCVCAKHEGEAHRRNSLSPLPRPGARRPAEWTAGAPSRCPRARWCRRNWRPGRRRW